MRKIFQKWPLGGVLGLILLSVSVCKERGKARQMHRPRQPKSRKSKEVQMDYV